MSAVEQTPIEAAIVGWLRSFSPAPAEGRIHTLRLPQSPVLPAVRVLLVDDGELYHLRGSSGVARARLQVDAYAAEASGVDPYAAAADVAAAINGDGAGSGLSGFRGPLAGSPPVVVLAIFRIDRAALYEPAEIRAVRIRQDYVVWYRVG